MKEHPFIIKQDIRIKLKQGNIRTTTLELCEQNVVFKLANQGERSS